MISFCLQISRMMYGKTAVSYFLKDKVARDIAAELHNWNMNSLVNLYGF